MVEADQRFWHPFTAFGMAEEMVSHLLCQVDEAGCILVKQNEIVQESPKKGYGPKGGCHLSVSLPGYVNHPWRGLVYEHIDSLFHDNVVDWDLIETHWQDLLRVVISIQEGKVLPSMLLRKLTTYSRKNRLYQAFHALGCVVRTVFLLTLISDVKLREVIHRATNKVEQYNALEDWVRFARGGTMYEQAFEEQEKQVKYTGLLTNCVILDNTIEISAALNMLASEGVD